MQPFNSSAGTIRRHDWQMVSKKHTAIKHNRNILQDDCVAIGIKRSTDTMQNGKLAEKLLPKRKWKFCQARHDGINQISKMEGKEEHGEEEEEEWNKEDREYTIQHTERKGKNHKKNNEFPLPSNHQYNEINTLTHWGMVDLLLLFCPSRTKPTGKMLIVKTVLLLRFIFS